MQQLNKKADGGLTAIVIIVIILVFIGWLVKLNNRECTKDRDCGIESYCGSDFTCHRIPIIEKTNSIVQYDLKWPSVIIGISVIIAAIIIKGGKIPFRKEKEVAHSKEHSHSSYYHPYDSNNQANHKQEHH